MTVSTGASQSTETFDCPVVCHFADGTFISTGPCVLIRHELQRVYDYGHRVQVSDELSLEVEGSGRTFPLAANADDVRLRRHVFGDKRVLVQAYAQIPSPGLPHWIRIES
ncbi:hypothetical protein SEA_JALAMMAH_11 [Gordonia phage Jalammah]|nr:hypothetical protein SEA_JALAMMAH_11 [Gordonia phage Jalammah]